MELFTGSRRQSKPRSEASKSCPALVPQEVVLNVDARDRDSVIAIAAYYIARSHGVGSIPIARALTRREDAGSTALGFGLAIPHARIEGLAAPATLFLRTKHPMPFRAPDGQNVSNFLFIMVPANGDAESHLQLLAGVAAKFGDPDFRGRLSAATTAEQVEDAFAA